MPTSPTVLPSFTHQKIVTLLKKHTNSKKLAIVDYGCGAGALLEHLPARMISHYSGYEISQAGLDSIAKSYPQLKKKLVALQPGKVPKLGSKQSVDALILIGVWQYLTTAEQREVLKQAREILKPNGSLLISCSVEHAVYQFFNLYRFITPHHYIKRQKIQKQLTKAGFTIAYSAEKGLLIAPFFSNCLSFIFDAIDYLFWRKPGALGPVGVFARRLVYPLVALEGQLPVDFGYTLFLAARPKK